MRSGLDLGVSQDKRLFYWKIRKLEQRLLAPHKLLEQRRILWSIVC